MENFIAQKGNLYIKFEHESFYFNPICRIRWNTAKKLKPLRTKKEIIKLEKGTDTNYADTIHHALCNFVSKYHIRSIRPVLHSENPVRF